MRTPDEPVTPEQNQQNQPHHPMLERSPSNPRKTHDQHHCAIADGFKPAAWIGWVAGTRYSNKNGILSESFELIPLGGTTAMTTALVLTYSSRNPS